MYDCSLFIFDKLTAFTAMLDGCLYYFSKCTFLDPFATDELCAAILILTMSHHGRQVHYQSGNIFSL